MLAAPRDLLKEATLERLTYALPVKVVRCSSLQTTLDVVEVCPKELVELLAVPLEALAVLVDAVLQIVVEDLLS